MSISESDYTSINDYTSITLLALNSYWSNYRIPGHLKYSMLNSNIQAVNKDEFQKYIFIPDPNPKSFP